MLVGWKSSVQVSSSELLLKMITSEDLVFLWEKSSSSSSAYLLIKEGGGRGGEREGGEKKEERDWEAGRETCIVDKAKLPFSMFSFWWQFLLVSAPMTRSFSSTTISISSKRCSWCLSIQSTVTSDMPASCDLTWNGYPQSISSLCKEYYHLMFCYLLPDTSKVITRLHPSMTKILSTDAASLSGTEGAYMFPTVYFCTEDLDDFLSENIVLVLPWVFSKTTQKEIPTKWINTREKYM